MHGQAEGGGGGAAAEYTWDDWAEWYANLFSLTESRDGETIGGWISDAFLPSNYSPADMREATHIMLASGKVPAHRLEHLSLLLAAAKEQRSRRLWKEQRHNDESAGGGADFTECKDCGNTGRVTVPNDEMLRCGVWHEMAVLCWCPKGALWLGVVRSYRGKSGPQLTLEDYEKLVPDWRERAAAERARRPRLNAISHRTAEADRAMGKVKSAGDTIQQVLARAERAVKKKDNRRLDADK